MQHTEPEILSGSVCVVGNESEDPVPAMVNETSDSSID